MLERDAPDPIIGEADSFLAVLERVSRVAPLSKPVLVIGERGTGKELIAARLHYLSERWQRAFVKFNCAAVNEELLEIMEYGEVERVGSSETIKIDVRLIGAANVDLPALARRGKFREDLLD